MGAASLDCQQGLHAIDLLSNMRPGSRRRGRVWCVCLSERPDSRRAALRSLRRACAAVRPVRDLSQNMQHCSLHRRAVAQ